MRANKKVTKAATLLTKGFTLIELLAVIVILAIIALIATLIIMNVIENIEKSATMRSAESYFKAVETAITTERLNDNIVVDGEYTLFPNGKLVCDNVEFIVEMNGDYPKVGSTVVIEDGLVIESKSSIIVDKYEVKYNEEKDDSIVENYNRYAHGTKYVIDPGDGIYRIFYVLEDGDNTSLIAGTTGMANKGEVSLIMDRNIDDVAPGWCIKKDYLEAGGTAEEWETVKNNRGPVTANKYLLSKTIDWSNVKVSLPTAEQILAVDGYTFEDGNRKLRDWMYINLTNTVQGYWTSTPSIHESNANLNTPSDAYRVVNTGKLLRGLVSYQYYYGVRPVITLSKTDLNK